MFNGSNIYQPDSVGIIMQFVFSNAIYCMEYTLLLSKHIHYDEIHKIAGQRLFNVYFSIFIFVLFIAFRLYSSY